MSGEGTIIGPDLPNIPWQDRPAGCDDVLWRYSGNPIVPRDLIPTSNSIFNSAAVPFGDGFAGVFRCDDTSHTPFGDIFLSESPDLTYWGRHRFVMGPSGGWQGKKVGAGPVPIETTEGWLLIYHGAADTVVALAFCHVDELIEFIKANTLV